ncbi:hypothetical protein ISS85_02765 [Candidatus Microgenomates bacterium]|nr:hypothetical protein [Candidatus Microgenomates bacterium]
MKNRLSFLLLSIIIFLTFANLIASNKLSTTGKGIKALEEEMKELNSENSSLELEIARTSSISGVIKKADSLGFVRSPKVFYLKGDVPVAMK